MSEAEIGRSLVDQLPVLHGVIRQVCSRTPMSTDDRAEFTSIVLLKLVENDFAVFRTFRGNSLLATYLHTVVKRLLFDMRTKKWGKWRPSITARRIGPLATTLERLVTRDGLVMQEVVTTLKQDPAFLASSSDVWRVHDALPTRTPRPRQVDLGDCELLAPHDADAHLILLDLEKKTSRVRGALAEALASLPPEDRRLLRMRFQDDLSVASIASLTGTDPKRLYRRFSRLLETVRTKMKESQLTSSDVAPLIGNTAVDLGALFTQSSAACG